jgi:pSer/pThr/pTyr-binding forkhead associated (FHA) protein
MGDDRRKTPRTLLVADHLWDALAEMASEMGSDREALLNQALYTFARLNGFVVPREPSGSASRPPAIQVDESLLEPEPEVATAAGLPAFEGAGPTLAAEPAPAPTHRGLVLIAEGRPMERVDKDRFLIGRGKHCDLVLNSTKVSREHAVITREGLAFFIEDLGSSNGTWFEKRRIGKRQIGEGDEYLICAEKLRCSFRE